MTVAEYRKKYYKDNKEKIRAGQKKYYENNKEVFSARRKKDNENNPEKVRAYRKKYYEDNKEAVRKCQKKYYQSTREARLAYYKKHRESSPGRGVKYRAVAKRRARAAFIEHVDPLIVLELHDGVCGICGNDVDPFQFHVDHIVPLAVGGLHNYANTQPAHPVCNYKKGTKIQHAATQTEDQQTKDSDSA